jgi:hypothetical protein
MKQLGDIVYELVDNLIEHIDTLNHKSTDLENSILNDDNEASILFKKGLIKVYKDEANTLACLLKEIMNEFIVNHIQSNSKDYSS